MRLQGKPQVGHVLVLRVIPDSGCVGVGVGVSVTVWTLTLLHMFVSKVAMLFKMEATTNSAHLAHFARYAQLPHFVFAQFRSFAVCAVCALRA